MSNQITQDLFKKEYPLSKYGSTSLKVLLNDIYRMELTEEDLQFLKALNMIGLDDFEIDALKNEYLEAGIKNFFTECTPEVDKSMYDFIRDKDASKAMYKEKEKHYSKEIQTMHDDHIVID